MPRSPSCGPRDALKGDIIAYNCHVPEDPAVGSTSSATLLILMIRRICYGQGYASGSANCHRERISLHARPAIFSQRRVEADGPLEALGSVMWKARGKFPALPDLFFRQAGAKMTLF